MFVTKGEIQLTAVKDAAQRHKDCFTGLMGTCVQHMVKFEQSESHGLERPTETWLQTTTAHAHTNACTNNHVLVHFLLLQRVEGSSYYFSF